MIHTSDNYEPGLIPIVLQNALKVIRCRYLTELCFLDQVQFLNYTLNGINYPIDYIKEL